MRDGPTFAQARRHGATGRAKGGVMRSVSAFSMVLMLAACGDVRAPSARTEQLAAQLQTVAADGNGEYGPINVGASYFPGSSMLLIVSNNPETFTSEGILFRTAFSLADAEEDQADHT